MSIWAYEISMGTQNLTVQPFIEITIQMILVENIQLNTR